MIEFMSDFMDVEEKPEHVLHVGDVCVITRSPYSTEHATWLQAADKVEVIPAPPASPLDNLDSSEARKRLTEAIPDDD